MSALVSKIRHSFSDLWLEIDLFFSKLKRKKKTGVISKSDLPTPKEDATSELHPAAPATETAPAPPLPKDKESPLAVTTASTGPPATAPAEKPEESAIPSVEEAKKTAQVKKETTTTAIGKVLKKKKEKTSEKTPVGFRFLRLSARERMFYYDQMATLVDSGVTLIDALAIVKAQSKSKSLRKLYGTMIHHINGGMGLAETMYLFPHVFPAMQSALIEAGEKSGNLKTVLAQIVDALEDQNEFVRKIKGAMFYPVVLLILALTMVTGMMIFVIPKVAELYKQSNATLPTITQGVINISNFLSERYLILFGGLFGVILLFWLLFSKTKPGKLMWEKFASGIPVFGRISKEKNIMLFASNLGMLLQSGVLISDAFKITEKTLDNLHYKRGLEEIRHGIIMGKSVSEIMGLEDIKTQKFKENKLFPLQVAQLIHIGEITGSIDKMLIKIRDNYHKSINYTLKNISTLIEPLMIFVVAILVGSILLAVMLPFFYIGSTIS